MYSLEIQQALDLLCISGERKYAWYIEGRVQSTLNLYFNLYVFKFIKVAIWEDDNKAW